MLPAPNYFQGFTKKQARQVKKALKAKAAAKAWVRVALASDWVTRHRLYNRIADWRVQKWVKQLMTPDELLHGESLAHPPLYVICLPDKVGRGNRGQQLTLHHFWRRATRKMHFKADVQMSLHAYFTSASVQ